jgi:hypothetical protein
MRKKISICCCLVTRIQGEIFRKCGTLQIFGNESKNQHLIQEENKNKSNYGNSSYQSVQNLLSSRLLSKNVKIRIYKTIILPVVLYGCETWSLTLREEQELRRVFRPKGMKWQEDGEICIMRRFILVFFAKYRVFKKIFTTLKPYINVSIEHVQYFEL